MVKPMMERCSAPTARCASTLVAADDRHGRHGHRRRKSSSPKPIEHAPSGEAGLPKSPTVQTTASAARSAAPWTGLVSPPGMRRCGSSGCSTADRPRSARPSTIPRLSRAPPIGFSLNFAERPAPWRDGVCPSTAARTSPTTSRTCARDLVASLAPARASELMNRSATAEPKRRITAGSLSWRISRQYGIALRPA